MTFIRFTCAPQKVNVRALPSDVVSSSYSAAECTVQTALCSIYTHQYQRESMGIVRKKTMWIHQWCVNLHENIYVVQLYEKVHYVKKTMLTSGFS